MTKLADLMTSRAGARRRLTYAASAVAAVAVAASVAAVAMASSGSAGAAGTPGSPRTSALFTSGTCEHEAALITAALDTDWVPADVDGDGATDRVATATDHGAAPRCRAFVGVRTADGTSYSTVLEAPAVPPPGMQAELIGLPDLGTDGRADLVVDTHLMVDGALAQLFTLADQALHRVHVPAFEDGNFVVEGGGVLSPRGAGCTSDGSLVLSMALLDGDAYEVTRHVYPVTGGPLRLESPGVTSDKVPGDQLTARFPEFATPHFADCQG